MAIVAGMPAAAQEPQHQAAEQVGIAGVFDEARIGTIFSLMASDDSGAIVSGELYFRNLGEARGNFLFDTFLRPRPFVGGNFATGEEGIDQAYFGLSWHFPVLNFAFVEATFGGTVHDAPLHEPGDGPFLGCHLLFHESGAVGLNLGPRWTIVAQVDHSSHAGLCGEANTGLTHGGAYIGYKF